MTATTSSAPSLFPYQQRTIEFIEAAGGNVILGHETGVGKTACAIRYCADRNLRTLVIVPASLKRQWQREIERFAPGSRAVIWPGSTDEQLKLYDVWPAFIIINYELLPKHGKELANKELDCVILDEAQYIKEYRPAKRGRKHPESSQRAHLVHTLFGDVPHKLLLTGTAIKSRPVELWSLLHFLDPFRWPDPWKYGAKMGFIREGFFGTDLKGEGDGLAINRDIQDVYLRYTKAEVRQDMPPKLRSNLTLELSPSDASRYRSLERAWLALDFEGAHLAALSRLRHLCADLKVKYMKEFIETLTAEGHKVVVFSSFVSTLDKMEQDSIPFCTRIDGNKSSKQRDEAVQRFMYGDANLFLIQTQAGGVGLNLNHPKADTCIFLDLPWTPADVMQAEDRIYRVTNTTSVTSVRPVFAGTVEEEVARLIERKERTLAKVLEGKPGPDVAELEVSVLDELIAHYKER